MTRHITIAASKGGTGKTTTTWNLGFGLALAGARVLLVDTDPQDNIRIVAGVEKPSGTVLSAIESGEVKPTQIREGISVLPSGGRKLAQVVNGAGTLREMTSPLRRGLSAYEGDGQFDFVLFDCPPEFGRLTQGALALSDYLLIPCISTWLGLRSIEQMMEFIDTHERDAKIEGERTGVVMTFYTTRRQGPELVRQEAKKIFGKRLFRTVIRERSELDYSLEANKSVFEYASWSDGAHDYGALVKELIRRLA
ncbi:MAG TPA: ParA family protein [Blastocatellia bacterium]|nr:ParA family protein [Blastocatellia bacterium]